MEDKYWICSRKCFKNFTYGRIYECVKDKWSYLHLINDVGQISTLSKITIEFGEYKVNFMTRKDWTRKRTQKINEILNLPTNSGLRD